MITDPALRGLRVGRRLAEAALTFSEECSCWEAFACIEGFNTSSSRLRTSHGSAILFFLPVPGSVVYPRGDACGYQDLIPKLCPTALAGASAVLAFAWALPRLGTPPLEITPWYRAAHSAGVSLALFEVLLPFFLFASFNGRRVLD